MNSSTDFFQLKTKTKPLTKWENHLKLLWPLLRSLLQACLPTELQAPAHLAIQNGLSVLRSNKRKVVGFVLLMVGVFGIFSHQLFFNEAVRDHSWYYLNWYYLVFTLRPYIVLLFWSAGFILFIPTQYRLAFIPFSLANSFAWIGLLHYSFFVDSNESFHAFPEWSIIVASVALGFTVIMSLESLAYWLNHKVRGNHSRFVGIAEMDLAPEQKEAVYKSLAKEFREVNKMI